MALAIDGSTPAVATQGSATVATVTTASFTPPAGSLLLELYAANTVDPTSPSTPTITDNLGVHLTYALSDFSARADGPAVDGQAADWTAAVASSAAQTVTVTNQAPSGSRHAALASIVLTGAHATPVGAHGKSGSTSAASIAQSYTAQATGSLGFIAVIDWDAKGAMTAGTGCTLIGSGNLGTPDISYGFFRRTTADGSTGVSNTLNVTLGGTSTNVRWVYVEIVPAAVTAGMVPQPTRHRPAWPRPIPAAVRITAPVRGQVNPPIPVQEVDQTRRLRGMFARRGRTVAPVRSQINPPFPTAEVDQARRVRGLFLRRGRSVVPAPAQAVVTAPAFPFAETEHRVRALFQRRGKSTYVVPTQTAATGTIAFDATGSTSVLVGATSTTVDITAAAVGAWCYCWVALVLNSGAVAATGWTSLLDADEGVAAHYALLRRQKQPGDTTFSFTWTNSTKGTLAWASWTGLDSATPDEQATLATNGVTGRTAVPTPSATPTAGNRWAAAFFGVRTSTVGNKPITWAPDGATTERIDVDNNLAGSSPWSGVEIADTNTAVTQAAHSYTATHNASEGHDGSAILFLIPGAAAAAPSLPLLAMRRLRTTWPRIARLRTAKPAAVADAPPQEIDQTRRARVWQPRRGKQTAVVPPQVVVTPPAFPPADITQPRRLRGLLVRRGRTASVPLVGVTPPTTQAPPLGPARRLTRLLEAVRRGRTTTVVSEQKPPPGQHRDRPNLAPARRSRTVQPPIRLAVPPVFVAPNVRHRLAQPLRRVMSRLGLTGWFVPQQPPPGPFRATSTPSVDDNRTSTGMVSANRTSTRAVTDRRTSTPTVGDHGSTSDVQARRTSTPEVEG